MKKNILFFICLAIGIFALLYAQSTVQLNEKPEGITMQDLARELSDEIKQAAWVQNRRGYYRRDIPTIGPEYGLKYSLYVRVDLVDVQTTSVNETLNIYTNFYSDFLTKLNSIKNIRPFLAEFPITPNTFHLGVMFFKNNQFEDVNPPFIDATLSDHDNVWMNQYENKGLNSFFKTIFRRPVMSIPEISQLIAQGVKRGPNTGKPLLLATEFTTHGVFDQIPCEFAPSFCKQHNLHFITSWKASTAFDPLSEFSFALMGNQQILLDEARKIGAMCAKQFFEYAMSRPEAVKLIVEGNKNRPKSLLHPEAGDFDFRISFWDENIDRQEQPYIAEIRFYGNTFKYFTSDEGQRLVLVYEESFDEAMKFLEKS
jgi:hypothetical protein